MIDRFDPDAIAGLTEEEAGKRLREEGYNELPSTKERSVFTIVFEGGTRPASQGMV
jgi:P-type Ca2+ transporter type 2C